MLWWWKGMRMKMMASHKTQWDCSDVQQEETKGISGLEQERRLT
jgi:hypothetical protein